MPRTLRSLRTLAAGSALVLLLASCGLIESLAGPQQLSDPLGLHGQDVTLQQGFAPATGTQATTTYRAQLGPAPVPDIDASGIPDWFDPNSLHVDVGVMATVRLESALASGESSFPETFELDGAALADFAIVDDEGEPRVDLDPVSTPTGAGVTLQRESCTAFPPLICTYTAQTGLDGFVMTVDVEDEAMNDLYTILTGGAATNTASGSFHLTATGTVPSDTTVTITIDAPAGILYP